MTADTPEPPLPFGRKTIEAALGKFDAFEKKGAGTFGATFRVTRGKDTHALKVIEMQGVEDFRWDRELTALRAIRHEHVVQYADSGKLVFARQEYPYLFMEYLGGGNLQARVESGVKPTSAKDLRALGLGLLRGVGALHSAGVIHRDLKPQNTCMRDSGWGSAVIVDLGMAKVDGMQTETIYPRHLGTIAYMAPEQLRRERAKKRSDVFALGVVLYQVGTGKHPFLDSTPCTVAGLIDRIQKGPPRSPEKHSAAFDPPLASTVMQMLCFREQDRPDVDQAIAAIGGK